MRFFTEKELRKIGQRLLEAAGVPAVDAGVVTDELVTTSLMGLDSHGIIRLSQYLNQLSNGSIKPGRAPKIVRETPTALVVDGGRNFGMVTARFMTDAVGERARRHQLSCAVSQRVHHVGRLGSFVQRLAGQGLFGIAAANASRQGHYVTPWGGSKGRLGTNPLAYGCPNGSQPIVLDMSTSSIAEGSIRAVLHAGGKLPDGCILDPEGRPSIEPADFYRDGGGTILPFGGRQGYKGFGLSLLVELLGSVLAGVPLTPDGESDEYINGFFILAIDPSFGCDIEIFQQRVKDLCEYLRSSPAAPDSDTGVVLPGERDQMVLRQRLSEGIPLADETWQELVAAGARIGVNL